MPGDGCGKDGKVMKTAALIICAVVAIVLSILKLILTEEWR